MPGLRPRRLPGWQTEAVAYPKGLLSEGERIELELHPHWRALVIPFTLVPVVVGLAAYLAAQAPHGSWHGRFQLAVLVIAALILVFFSGWPWLKWVTTQYVFTNKRVHVRTGVLARQGRDIPLNRVNDVGFTHTVPERILRSGTLTIESAGERGQVVLRDVPKVEKVQAMLYRLVEAGGDRGTVAGDPGQLDQKAPEGGA